MFVIITRLKEALFGAEGQFWEYTRRMMPESSLKESW